MNNPATQLAARLRSVIAAAFPTVQTDAQFRVGETLPDAFARRLNVRADRPHLARHVDDEPHLINRTARRAAGVRRPLTVDELAEHCHPTYRKAAR